MKNGKRRIRGAAFGSLIIVLLAGGCQGGIPEEPEHRGAAIGGAAGAALGGAVGGWEGAVLGGLIGAGGGYVIGAEQDRVREGDEEGAREAARSAERDPASAEEARQATTADINGDGFVTLDEVVAMSEAEFSDEEMIDRLEATNQVFELTPDQESRLVRQGVSQAVVDQMSEVNRELSEPPPEDEVIGRQP